MNEECRSTGRGKSSSELGADMAALADARNDQTSARGDDTLHRFDKGAGKAVVQRFFKRCEARIFGLYGAQRRSNSRFRICRRDDLIELFHGGKG